MLRLNREWFLDAMNIIAKYHSTTIAVNLPISGNFVGYIEDMESTLHIKKCCPALINELHAKGFVLSQDENGLNVERPFEPSAE